MASPENQPPESVEFHTDVKVEETLFRWSIKDLLILPYENGKKIESPPFSSTKNPEIKWKLRLYPNGDKHDDSINNISIYLQLLSESTKVSAKVTFSIWNSKTKHSFKQMTFNREFEAPATWGYSKFCSHQDFLKSTVAGDENHDVIIECKIVTHAEWEHTASPRLDVAFGPKEESVNVLTSDYNNLLKSEKFADFTLVSSDGVEFSTHKNILSARSPVFFAMLEKPDMIEIQQNRAVIADMDSNTIKELVQYICTGKSDNLDTMAKELLVASDKYELNPLRNLAVKELNRTMSLENVLEICVTAHLHNAPGLKKNALFFMKRNANEIVKLCNWECFVKDYPSLVTELFSI